MPEDCKLHKVSDRPEALARADVDTLLVDARLRAHEADRSGLDLIAEGAGQAARLPAVVLTGASDRDLIADAYARGAHACLAKSATEPTRLLRTLRDADETRALLPSLAAIAGESTEARALRERVSRYARSDAPVLVTGPTGSGKELVARALHELSGRKGPLITVNLAGRHADPMLLADLFGHTQGAFTGATRERPGAFHEAADGTLFLDEVGDLPLESQGFLLRAIEARRFVVLGATRETAATARFVFATHVDLRARVKAGLFREDLLSRLDALRVRVPGLAERPVDIAPIALRFARTHSVMLGDDAVTWLEQRPYEANARTLRNIITRVAESTDRGLLTRADFIQDAEASGDLEPGSTASPPEPLEEELRRLLHARVRQAVALHGGNESAAARALNIDRTKLRRVLAGRKLRLT